MVVVVGGVGWWGMGIEGSVVGGWGAGGGFSWLVVGCVFFFLFCLGGERMGGREGGSMNLQRQLRSRSSGYHPWRCKHTRIAIENNPLMLSVSGLKNRKDE